MKKNKKILEMQFQQDLDLQDHPKDTKRGNTINLLIESNQKVNAGCIFYITKYINK